MKDADELQLQDQVFLEIWSQDIVVSTDTFDHCVSLTKLFLVIVHQIRACLSTDSQQINITCSTVRCLGVLSGSMLLGMTREELKTVCPEEGGRVFYQLKAVKSTMAVSERPQF